MKAQTLGMVLGVNLAVACLALQGCKSARSAGEAASPEEVKTVETGTAQPPAETKDAAEQKPVVATQTVAEAPAPAVEPAKETVPPPQPVAEPAKPATTPYQIKKGETLSGIAYRYGLRTRDILAVNPGLNANKIRYGRTIQLPGAVAVDKPVAHKAPAHKTAKAVKSAKTVKPAKAASTKAPAGKKAAYKPYTGATKEYVVVSGDTLGKIAYGNGITIRGLKELNNIKKNELKVGQKLKVPAEKPAAPEAAPAEATPAPEAATPAPAEAATPAAPEAATPAAPEAATPAAPVAEAAAAPAAPADGVPATYTVGENEDIYAVAIKWGVSASALKDINGLKDGDTLKPGQVIKLPAGASAQ